MLLEGDDGILALEFFLKSLSLICLGNIENLVKLLDVCVYLFGSLVLTEGAREGIKRIADARCGQFLAVPVIDDSPLGLDGRVSGLLGDGLLSKSICIYDHYLGESEAEHHKKQGYKQKAQCDPSSVYLTDSSISLHPVLCPLVK